MIPLLLLTLTLVAILAYLMGYHDGSRRWTEELNDLDEELHNLRECFRDLDLDYAALISDYDELVAQEDRL